MDSVCDFNNEFKNFFDTSATFKKIKEHFAEQSFYKNANAQSKEDYLILTKSLLELNIIHPDGTDNLFASVIRKKITQISNDQNSSEVKSFLASDNKILKDKNTLTSLCLLINSGFFAEKNYFESIKEEARQFNINLLHQKLDNRLTKNQKTPNKNKI